MSKSIHTTKKDLKRERTLEQNEHDITNGAMTELEENYIHKNIYKINNEWERQSNKDNAPIKAEISHDISSHEKTINTRKQK